MAANKVTAVHGKRWEQIPSYDLGAVRLGLGGSFLLELAFLLCASDRSGEKPFCPRRPYSLQTGNHRPLIWQRAAGCIARRTVVRDGFRTEPFLQHFRENDFPLACWEVKGLRRGRRLSARRLQAQRNAASAAHCLTFVGDAMNDLVDRILTAYQLTRAPDGELVADSRRKITGYIESLAAAGQRDAKQLTVYGLAYLKELHEGRDPRFTGC
jgi:hypothetical protein